MAAKPTQDPKWVTTDDPQHIIEPTAALKLNGVASGGIWGREQLNWMFNAISKWVDWVRSQALDRDNNLTDLSDKSIAFSNIKVSATTSSTGVIEKATAAETVAGTADKFPDAKEIKTERDKLLVKNNNLSDVSSASTTFNNIKQKATTSSTGVVEKATTAEMTAGTAEKYPDAAEVKNYYGEAPQSVLIQGTSISGGTSGSISVAKSGKIVTITGRIGHASATTISFTDFLPDWAIPTTTYPATVVTNMEVISVGGAKLSFTLAEINLIGTLTFRYIYGDTSGGNSGDLYRSRTTTSNFTIVYQA